MKKMAFLEKISTFLKKILSLKIYFGKSIKNISPDAIVFFPIQDNQCNCGLTGIVAFKKEKVATPKISLGQIESMILSLKGHTYKKIHREKADLTDKYLCGEAFLKELHDHVGTIKLTSSLYTIFREVFAREKLKKVSLALEKVINGEENEYHQRLNILSFKENEIIIKRIQLLKDVHWSLKEEILKNLEKIEELSAFTNKDLPCPAFTHLKSMNTLFNNVDRLEVRGQRLSRHFYYYYFKEKRTNFEFEKGINKKIH